MKKFTAALLILTTLLFAAACKKTDVTETTTVTPTESTSVNAFAENVTVGSADASEILVVCFSHNDNADAAAEFIAEETGGTLFYIDTLTQYPDNAQELESMAEAEYKKNVRPALETKVSDISSAGVLFVCYPVWADNMPMALYTFLEDYDLRDKFIIPVAVSENGEWANSLYAMQALLSGSMFVEGTALKNDDVLSMESEIKDFAENALK